MRLGLLSAADQLLLERRENSPAACLLDGLDRLAIATGSPAVACGDAVRFMARFELRHVHEEPPAALRRVSLRLVVEASSQILETNGCLSPRTPPSL